MSPAELADVNLMIVGHCARTAFFPLVILLSSIVPGFFKIKTQLFLNYFYIMLF